MKTYRSCLLDVYAENPSLVRITDEKFRDFFLVFKHILNPIFVDLRMNGETNAYLIVLVIKCMVSRYEIRPVRCWLKKENWKNSSRNSTADGKLDLVLILHKV